MKRMENVEILPMAAIGLMLVLMMMVIAPMTMTHTSTPVDVPKAHTAETKTEENLTVTYTLDDIVLVNDQPVDQSELATVIAQAMQVDPYQLVVIRADRNALHSSVLDILAIIKQAGARRIACATKKPKGE